jgi:hypothetical protein
MTTTMTIGKCKLEDIQAMGDGREQAKLYRAATDEFGRESWAFAGRVVRRVCESWGEAIERWEAAQ